MLFEEDEFQALRDAEFKEKVDKLIKENSKVIGDCLRWTGDYDTWNKPYTYYLGDYKLSHKVFPQILAYSSKPRHERFEIKPNVHRVVTTCGIKGCLNRDHLVLVNKNTQQPVKNPRKN